jgi:oligopeptide/dipeptide ABC transporter ATP-binding protein
VTAPLLEVSDLRVEFGTENGPVRAVDGVSFTVAGGEVLGVVGESGCGKSVTALSVLGLLPASGRVSGGSVRYRGRDLATLPRRELRGLRGGAIAMIFQDPMTTLNPVVTIGAQLVEALRLHQPGLRARAAKARAAQLLESVGVPQPAARLRYHPHELSGGMRQRAVIAMALANDPELLIADEPTTALDVTTQANVLDLLRTTQQADTARATILITHDLGVMAELADRVLVMYAGRIMEQAPVAGLFHDPRHPYTLGLLASSPRNRPRAGGGALPAIPGDPPAGAHGPGCPFHPRCPLANDRCRTETPELREITPGRRTACHHAEDLTGADRGLFRPEHG